MKRILAILTAAISLGFGTSAFAAELSGTINLADMGVTWLGATFTGTGRSGISVSDAGDFNGDGVSDLLIGAVDANNDTGAVYIVYGSGGSTAPAGPVSLSTVGTSVPGSIFNGVNRNDWLGRSVSAVGDVNGDGVDDILIAANGVDPNGVGNAGESYLIYGNTGASALTGTHSIIDVGSTIEGSSFAGIATNDQSGRYVSSAGDFNGDGLGDFLIGASSADPNGNFSAGEVYLLYGKDGPSALTGGISLSDVGTTVEGVTFPGVGGGHFTGWYVSSAGDINGDGIDDLLIGAYGASGIGSRSGVSYLIYGQSSAFALSGTIDLSQVGNSIEGVVFGGASAGDRSGISVSAAGDFNGDGIDDLLIGADQGTNHEGGEAYLIYGNAEASALSGSISLADIGNSVTGVIFEAMDAAASMGWSVADAGDINGDGVDDIIIGGFNPSPNDNTEKTYLIYGQKDGSALTGPLDLSSVGSSIEGAIFNGLGSSNWSGYSVSGAGDINDDGINDILIGAFGANSDKGETYLVYGNSAPPPLADFVAEQTIVNPGTTVQFHNLPINNPDRWLWAFGAGEGGSTVQDPSHQYDTTGFFDVSLTATNSDVSDTHTKTAFIEVVEAPSAQFMADLTMVNRGATVTFTDLSTGFIEMTEPFNVEGTGALAGNAHLFNTSGLFDVWLTVGNTLPGDGSDTELKLDYVEVVEASNAQFVFGSSTLHPGKFIRLYDQSDGFIESWEWLVFSADTFALVGTSNEQNPLFNFADPGTYHVQLTIDNTLPGNGRDFNFQLNAITVTPVPEPGTLVLFGLGLTALARKVRRRKSA